MLVLMPMPRAHAVEDMGWQSEDPISFLQALLPIGYFTIHRTLHFSMPHLLPHKSMTAFHRWELPYTSTNCFHLFNFKQLQDIYSECQEHRGTLGRSGVICHHREQGVNVPEVNQTRPSSFSPSHTSISTLGTRTTEMTYTVLKCRSYREEEHFHLPLSLIIPLGLIFDKARRGSRQWKIHI